MTSIPADPLLLAELQRSIAASERWLLEHVSDQGVPAGEAGHSYRLPYALALLGRRAEAAQVLAWMERDVLTSDGDLRPGPMRDGFTQRWSSYPLAIIAQASWHLERYGLARRIVRTLRGFQHPVFGGAYAQRPDVRSSGRQDLFPTAQLGMTAILVGDDDVAERAWRWMLRLYQIQRELPDRLYSATDADGALVTDLGEDPMERFGLCTDFAEPRQAFYNPGIAAAFLARYADRHAFEPARALAEQYLQLTVDGTPQQFDHDESVQVCKFGWGAANLLELTGDQQFRDHAERMARWFITTQSDDGSWDNSPFLLPDGPTVGSRLEITAEFAQHQIALATALASVHV